MATRTKQDKPAELRLSKDDERLLERFAAALQILREVDHVDMTIPRAEILVAVARHKERSLLAHGTALGLPSLNALRQGRAWTAVNAKGRTGYDCMVAQEAPFYAGSEIDEKAAAADARHARRLYVALNAKGEKLVQRLLLAMKG